MPKLGLVVLVALLGNPATAQNETEALFRQFALFGTWAPNCAEPASPHNLHVTVSMQSGQIVESHDIGVAGVVNHYRIVSARRLSATTLEVEVVFQPGTDLAEQQRLEWLVGDGTRRTMFNQPRRGRPVVKDGVALAFGLQTPVLRKCE